MRSIKEYFTDDSIKQEMLSLLFRDVKHFRDEIGDYVLFGTLKNEIGHMFYNAPLSIEQKWFIDTIIKKIDCIEKITGIKIEEML